MTASIKPLSKRTAWKNLAAHYKKIKEVPLSKLFADDPSVASGLRWKQPASFSITQRTASQMRR